MENNEETELIKKVNSLIKKSFGRKYSANYTLEDHIDEGGFQLSDKLNIIAKENKFENGSIFEIVGKIGENNEGKRDGSVIFIKFEEGYFNSAEKYAQLYKEKFNKKVVINNYSPEMRLLE